MARTEEQRKQAFDEALRKLCHEHHLELQAAIQQEQLNLMTTQQRAILYITLFPEPSEEKQP